VVIKLLQSDKINTVLFPAYCKGMDVAATENCRSDAREEIVSRTKALEISR